MGKSGKNSDVERKSHKKTAAYLRKGPKKKGAKEAGGA